MTKPRPTTSTGTTASPSRATAPPAPVDRELRLVVAIVVAGALLTVLDATVVSIAVESMANEFAASLSTIQWAMTGYILAMVAGIPLSGWAVDRFGGRRAWLVAVGTFVAGSALCAMAWSAPTLLTFRVLQGLGGGLVAPVGMTMVAQVAGRERMGRAMAMVGIPMMLGPVLGPVIGGVLVSALDWRWIFVLNLPVGLLALVWSTRALPAAEPSRQNQPLDRRGLLLLSPACALLVYGLSQAGGGLARPELVLPVAAGLMLATGFVVHAARTPHALLDIGPLRNRTFAAAAAIQLLMGGVLIGSMFLLPLYFQLGRGESAWVTGLLLTPQGMGAALALWRTGPLVDRGRGFQVILVGVGLTTSGLLTFTQASAGPAAWLLMASLLVMGMGTGCLMAPVSAAAYSVLDPWEIPRATSMLNVIQRLGGAFGTAAFALLLQHAARTSSPTPSDLGEAFGRTFWWPLAASAAMILPALLMRSGREEATRQRRPGGD